MKNSATLLAIGTVLFITTVVFVAISQLGPPNPVSVNAPPEEFSSGRALQHLQVIAAKPHPVGSPEHKKVRDYLLAELTNLGVEPRVHTVQVTRSRSAMTARFATLHNIVARIKGTENSRALMLVSHYDSVPNAPGATDDGSGVVTMLETLRALKHHPPLKNDLIFLFTDGEELGLLGAQGFAEQHPWLKDVGLVLNFEGSGSSGHVIMFETSDENGRLIAEFTKAAPFPVANSLSYEIYRRMPNDTDLTVFKKAGIPGLNFAYIDDRYDYHTLSDNIENIDEGALQHDGSYALALTRHFGNLDLSDIKASNSVYFNTFGWGFVHYPQKWAIPFMLLAILVYAAALTLGFRRKQVQLLALLKGLIAFLALVVTGPLIVAGLYSGLAKFFNGVDWWLLFYNDKLLLPGFALLTIGISAGLYILVRTGMKVWHMVLLAAILLLSLSVSDFLQWPAALSAVIVPMLLSILFRKGMQVYNLTMGSLLGWMILMIAVTLIIPGGSYLVTWPFLFAAVPLCVMLLLKDHDVSSIRNWLLFSIFSIPAILWFSQLAYLFSLSMGIAKSGATMVLLTVLLGLLMPHFEVMTSKHKWALPGVAGLLAIAILLMATAGADYDKRYRKSNTLFYGYNADADEYVWGSVDETVDEWTSEFLTDSDTSGFAEFVPTAPSQQMTRSQAPGIALTPPELTLLENKVEQDSRTVKMHIQSTRAAPYLNLFFSPGSGMTAANVSGIEVEGFENLGESAAKNWWRWRYYGLPKEGIDLTLQLDSSKSFDVQLLDVSYALPDFGNDVLKPRPEYMMPHRYRFTDMTLVRKRFTIPPAASSVD